jgi:NAD(P)-dependent dehydrogenase (short-subunit alcohol dehydrogenase family)
MLEGKCGIVTGGSRGMGRHFIAALVAAGAKVACFARPSPEFDTLEAEFGPQVAAIACDVASCAAVERATAATVARFARIDFLVNNAAIFHPFRLEDARPEQIERHVAINLTGPMWCMRAAIPHLRRTRGHILSISSESVRLPFPYLSVYASTKGGLEVLSAAIRDEVREDGIRVTVLRSGSVSGSTGSRDWDPKATQDFFTTIQRTGHAAFTGEAATPQSMATALVCVLSLPEDVNVDFLELRAALPASGKERTVPG